MMEAVRISETSVNFNVTTRRYIAEDSKLHIRHRENLKSHTIRRLHANRQVDGSCAFSRTLDVIQLLPFADDPGCEWPALRLLQLEIMIRLCMLSAPNIRG
jgi:hypothetical protein